MELLSRPPQRRKHSTATTTAFPVKSPYDDVFVARGGRGSPLEAHEYTEIFSGSSSAPPSIPVLDLSSLDERAVLGDFRVPVQDYSSIFGGLRNDDAAVPYQDLFGGFAKRAKPLRKSPDLSSPLQHSSPLHSSENTKSNGKSRGIQSPLQHSGSLRPSESTKKLVGEASNQSLEGGKQPINASFSRTNQRDSDAVNRKTHIAEPHSVSGFTGIADGTLRQQKADNHKPVPHSFESYSSKKPPSSSSPEKSSDATRSRVLNSASKEDVFKKSAVGYSLPFLDEELDENSVAAASAAALKKAIEQAQESIRVAKMLRGRKNEGRRERFKTRSSDDGEDLDKESKMPRDEYEEAGSTYWADFDQNDAVTKAGNVGSVPEKVEVAEGRSEEVERGSKLAQLGKNVENAELTTEYREEFATRGGSFASLFHKGENVYVGEKVQLEMNGENVEAAKGHGEDPESAATLVFSDSEEIRLREKVQPDGAESTEIDREKPSASHRMQDPADTVEEIEKSDATEDIFEPVERVLDTPQSTTAAKIVDEDAEKKISLEAKLDSLSKNNTDEHGMKFEECDELQNVEDLTEFESGFIDFSITTNHVIGRVLFEQEVVEKEAENVPCGEETEHGNEEENGMRREDVPLLFESKALEEEADKKIETHEPEIDTDWRPANGTDELKLPQELDPDNVEERPNGIREHEAAESRTVEANSYVEIQKDEAFWDMEETNITSEETGRSVEDGNICDYEEVVYDDDSDEAVDSNTLAASEVRETCVIDSIDENVEHGTVPEETEAEIEEDAEAEPMFDQETELPAVASLHRSASEGILLDGKQQNVFEGLSSDGKAENVIGTDSSDSKENLSEDEDVFEAADEIYGGKQKQEFNLTDAKPVLEQTSESDQGSESTCSLDNIDQFSAHESEGDAENVKDQTSMKEEFVPKDDKFVEAERTEKKSSSIEKEDPIGNFVMGDKNAEKVVENSERQQRIEAIKKAREQEKDRLVVERAIREARERAFAEARERAVRAAAEKTESRTIEAQKKLDKASTEAKFRAERAAVERATAEARERALEKALSMKTPSESRADSGLKHSFSSSDLENSTYTESARRRQARLERHQRIMERAAKALAEKNMRDILAQKEQAERNRLAESLDAEIKRWVSGKEGNLRALLSTLQYILGRDSGWQPIPLTEVVTTAAVKKAYRKATLYVHPDKLQQRGASIQQKYICEKVFDLLKAAWNRFNSEER